METLAKKSLFWDSPKLDPQKNKRFILERILNFGDVDDFRWAIKSYGKNEIKENVLSSKTLDKKSLSFWCQYFNLDQKRCLKNQSARKQSWFWKR